MKILVTGANGFIGKHVCRELEEDHELLTPSHQELDLINPSKLQCECCIDETVMEQLWGILYRNKVDAIVHLAATCGGIGINSENPGKFIYENLQMGLNVLEAARTAGVPKVVNLGTVCAYPKFAKIPFREEEIWDGYPEETNAPYGIAKKTIMEMGQAYARQYGMDVTNLVPVNMAGEWDNFDESSSHVIPALIRKFEHPTTSDVGLNVDIEAGIANWRKFVTLWGTGSASREFLYAGDCARAIAVALQKKTGPEPINLGTGREITIADLAAMIKRIGGYDADIIWDQSKPDGQPRRSLDITRAKNMLRWEPRVELEEIVRRTIDYYRTSRS